MTRIYVDATTLIALGTVGELALLEHFDGEFVIVPAVRDEVTTEPAATNVERWLDAAAVETDLALDSAPVDQAREMLGEVSVTGDVQIVAGVLAATTEGTALAVVSDDRRGRTVCDGLGAHVTGTV